MVDNFYDDLAKAKEAELLALNVFANMTTKYSFEAVGDNWLYFHTGDIKVTDKESGKVHFIEIKDDSRICDTHNVLCEERVYYYKEQEIRAGNMYSDYEIYAVVSRAERKIYVIDFKILKAHYKQHGFFKTIKHKQQESDCYLCQLADIESWGGLIAVVEY